MSVSLTFGPSGRLSGRQRSSRRRRHMDKAWTVLLATDGSPQAEVAARLVGALLLPAGAGVESLRADEPFAVDAELPPDAYAALREAIHEEIEKDVASAKAAVSAP